MSRRNGIEQGLAYCKLFAKSDPLPNFVHKGLLKHSHVHLFTCFLRLFLCYVY